MAIDKDLIDPAVESETDKLHRVGRTLASLMPAGTGVFEALVTSPVEKRKQEWMLQVSDAILKLEKYFGISLDQLQENDSFISTVLYANNIALRNHQEEKITCLRNAIYNAGSPHALEESLQFMFLGLIDSFTVWHIKILDLFSDPISWASRNDHSFPNMSMGGRSSLLEGAFPEMRGKRWFYDPLWSDLYQKGLVGSDTLHITMSGTGLFQSGLTEIGGKFIDFVRTPDEET